MELQPPQPVQQKTSGLAIASLVTSLCCLGVVGVVCGHMALSKIKKSAGALTGGGMAVAGLIIGYVSIILGIFVGIPTLFVGARAWKVGSDKAGCIINQRNVQMAVREYQAKNHLRPDDRIDWSKVGIAVPTDCPAGGAYSKRDHIPSTGVLALVCPHAKDELKHEAGDHTDW